MCARDGRSRASQFPRCEAARSCRHHRLARSARTISMLHRILRIAERHAIVLPDAPRVLAGRKEEDVRRAGADVADVLASEAFELGNVDPFALEERALH